MKVTEETKGLAQKVQDYIVMHPERHRQIHWFNGPTYSDSRMFATEENLCQTTMCIAGTAVFLAKGLAGVNNCLDNNSSEYFSTSAAELLGLDYEEANDLFFCMDEQVALDAVCAIAAGDEEKLRAILFDYNNSL